MDEYAVAYEIVRTFTNEELAHDPDPEEVMAILVRQVEHALRTVPKAEYWRLRSGITRTWVNPLDIDGDVGGP